MKWLFLVLSGVLIFIVITMGFVYPGLVGSPMMVILLVVLGLSAFLMGRKRQGK
jgi:hypothetical protein